MDLRWLTPDDADAVVAASDLFDHDVRREWAVRFLDDRSHHLCIAYEDGAPVGFVSAVELTHPDKGTEMFLYELAVAEASRRRGIGKALTAQLVDLARERGCYGVWVLTDDDNEAALHTYRSAGATNPESPVLLAWRLERDHVSFSD